MVAIVQKNVASSQAVFRQQIDATSPTDIPPIIVTWLNSLPVTTDPIGSGLAIGAYYWNGGTLCQVQP